MQLVKSQIGNEWKKIQKNAALVYGPRAARTLVQQFFEFFYSSDLFDFLRVA